MWTKMLSCTSLGVLVLLAAACGDSQPAPDPQHSTRELLGATVEFTLGQPGSALAITARRLDGADAATHRIALPVPAGSLALRAGADGDLRLEQLEFELDDIVIDAEDLPPAGLHLTDLRVTVDTDIAETSWSADGTAAVAALTASVTLEWALVSAGRVLPLAPQQITAVDLQIEVGPAGDGGVSVTLRGGHSGTVLRPAGTFELSDLVVEINASN
ncbi:MAG: hypothetical protein HY906_15895 [Deltaproteobacteria bacterium]|nr:hypothetical protein [Deltaproteobacteria bacterium]